MRLPPGASFRTNRAHPGAPGIPRAASEALKKFWAGWPQRKGAKYQLGPPKDGRSAGLAAWNRNGSRDRGGDGRLQELASPVTFVPIAPSGRPLPRSPGGRTGPEAAVDHPSRGAAAEPDEKGQVESSARVPARCRPVVVGRRRFCCAYRTVERVPPWSRCRSEH